MCGCPSQALPPGTWPATQTCVPTRNQSSDPLVCRPALHPLSHTSQGKIVSVLVLLICVFCFSTMTMDWCYLINFKSYFYCNCWTQISVADEGNTEPVPTRLCNMLCSEWQNFQGKTTKAKHAIQSLVLCREELWIFEILSCYHPISKK